MPLADYTITPLIVDLPNFLKGSIEIKRKADIVEQVWDIRGQQVRLAFDIIPYEKNEDDSYGERLDQLPNSIFTVKRVTIVAKNSFLVNAQTGAVIAMLGQEDTIPDDVTYMPDYSFYDLVAKTQPVILEQLIAQAILAYV